jgi:hypothetical protein
MTTSTPTNNPEHQPLPKWGRTSEEKLRRMFLHEAREQCKPDLEAFAKCAKETGWKVIFECRNVKNIANDCVKKYSTEEQYEVYKQLKKKEWIAQGILSPDNL